MISRDWVRMMARYAAWQNASHLTAAAPLSAADLVLDRGGFFGSIAATANHLLWGDRIWLSRFGGCETPPGGIPESPGLTDDWAAFAALRQQTDAEMIAWAKAAETEGELAWYSGAAGREVAMPRALCITHMFNHGTHHRGQIHAMLTAAGAKTDDTDLFLMPKEHET